MVQQHCAPTDVATLGFECFRRTGLPIRLIRCVCLIIYIIFLLRNMLICIAMLLCVLCLIVSKDMIQSLVYIKSPCNVSSVSHCRSCMAGHVRLCLYCQTGKKRSP
ncbi:hypothetical protein CRENBAI_001139 [Crenichthys baileyi]|uniref:Uncharacterized protein n=1 Tax=Crenichthys baileyi TaxID=28760 RepID=A0AAV9S8W3_9TELE